MQADNVHDGKINAETLKQQVERQVEIEKALHLDAKETKNNPGFISDCLDCLDLGDGLMFAFLNKSKFIYNSSSSRWFKWGGNYWNEDESLEVLSAVESTVVKTYLDELSRINEMIGWAMQKKDSGQVADLEAKRKRLIRRVDRLRTQKGRDACLAFAWTCGKPSLVAPGDLFDRNPWMFGCVNGTIDLRSGKFNEGDPSHYITMVSPVAWIDIDEESPAFESFIHEILGEDPELTQFMQRLLGQALIGCVIEHVLPIFFGEGRNGKSTLAEILRFVLGPLCKPIPSEMLLAAKFIKNAAAPNPEILLLKGLRVALAYETDENHRFNMNQIKVLTGGDALSARGLQDKHYTVFDPSHHMILLSNWLPAANGSDYAFWKRILVIKFPYSFIDGPVLDKNERPINKNLINELKEESSGILAWLVRGCLEYQRQGLNPPKSVKEWTSSYMRDEDILGGFINDQCELKSGLKENSTALYNRFVEWYKVKISEKGVPSPNRFGKWMRRRFKDTHQEKGCVYYDGIGLKILVQE